MAKNSISSRVRCPYCKCESKTMIYCEGVQQGTTLHLAFAVPSVLKEYRAKYCDTNYDACRIAQMLNQKYDQPDKG